MSGARRLLSVFLAGICAQQISSGAQAVAGAGSASQSRDIVRGTVYVPLDSWTYPALLRLQAMGVLDSAFVGLRPWTRVDIGRMLSRAKDSDELQQSSPEIRALFDRLATVFRDPPDEDGSILHPRLLVESQYTRTEVFSGTPLRDSFHLGQTVINDYGRPYQYGFDTIVGASGSAIAGRASLYLRAEYQHAPAGAGYDPQLVQQLAAIDGTPDLPQATIPAGPVPAAIDLRIVEATISYRVLNHQISFGKQDHWLGPAQGGSLLWSNNAENIYSFQIERTNGFTIPYFSKVFGPVRYEFFVGSLKGHTVPNDPWIHSEKISLKPTRNLEVGFSRATIWGGKGHAPITIGTFLHSFFSVQNVTTAEKLSRNDPGDRIGNFDFNYRLPFVRKWATLYCDSAAHDDVSPISAPRRAAFRTGVYFPQFPNAPKLDLRVEAVSTDPPVSRSSGGVFLYTESIQKQGFTNKGYLLGDAAGREGKGGEAWLTYHLSPAEQIQFAYRNQKNAKDFIPGGTTQNAWNISSVKRLHSELELWTLFQYETWKAPIYKSGLRQDVQASVQLTWFASRRLWPR